MQTFVGDAVAVCNFSPLIGDFSEGGTSAISCLHCVGQAADFCRIPIHDIPWQSR